MAKIIQQKMERLETGLHFSISGGAPSSYGTGYHSFAVSSAATYPRVRARPDGSIPKQGDSDFSDFLIGYFTGIPLSMAGFVGAAMSHGGDSSDYSSSSSSSDSSSSSSSDSGDGGGFDSGGGSSE